VVDQCTYKYHQLKTFWNSTTSITSLIAIQRHHRLAPSTEIDQTNTLAVWTLAVAKLSLERVIKRGNEALLLWGEFQLWRGGIRRALGEVRRRFFGWHLRWGDRLTQTSVRQTRDNSHYDGPIKLGFYGRCAPILDSNSLVTTQDCLRGPRGAGIRRLTGNRKLKATYTKKDCLVPLGLGSARALFCRRLPTIRRSKVSFSLSSKTWECRCPLLFARAARFFRI